MAQIWAADVALQAAIPYDADEEISQLFLVPKPPRRVDTPYATIEDLGPKNITVHGDGRIGTEEIRIKVYDQTRKGCNDITVICLENLKGATIKQGTCAGGVGCLKPRQPKPARNLAKGLWVSETVFSGTWSANN